MEIPLTDSEFEYAISAIEEKIDGMKETVNISKEYDIDCTETEYQLNGTEKLLNWIKNYSKQNEN